MFKIRVHPKKLLKKIKKVVGSPLTIKIAAGGLIAIVLINLILCLAFWHRTYPRTQVASQQIGNTANAKLGERLDQLKLLPSSIQLQTNNKTITVNVADLGVSVDKAKVTQNLKTQKSWLPIINLFVPPRIALQLSVNEDVFSKKLVFITNEFKQDAVNAQITMKDGNFSLQPDKTGQQLKSGALRNIILDDLSKGSTKVLPLTEILNPTIKAASLKLALENLQAQQKVSITYRYQDKSVKPSAQEIGLWYAQKDSTYIISTDKVQQYIAKAGSNLSIRVQNLTQAATATADALQKNKPLEFTLVAMPPAIRAYGYCVTSRGVDASFLSEFRAKLQAVYYDQRGWGLDSQVSFTEVTSGCNFTVWLSAADQMTTFGSICDPVWSCTVSPNVIINFDRWRYASTAWNQSGGSLDDYHNMVINHETGHFIGFGHLYCGGAGQLAPVMQQQSISLQGCQFNPWPLPSELASFRSRLGL